MQKSQGDRLASKMQEGAACQGTQVASRSQEWSENTFSPRASKRSAALPTPSSEPSETQCRLLTEIISLCR